MSSVERDEIIFGFTEKEVKFLLMSLKCIETHGNRRFLNCERLANITGYTPADAYEYYMVHLRHKVMALPPVDLTGGSDGQKKHADTAEASAEKGGKTGRGTGQDEESEEEQTKKDTYSGIGDGLDGSGGDPEDEKELEALGSAYAWDC